MKWTFFWNLTFFLLQEAGIFAKEQELGVSAKVFLTYVSLFFTTTDNTFLQVSFRLQRIRN